VVERGPTARLEIFRLRSASSSSSKPDHTWGVRTLDFIPRNAFVCEVTGQYVLGRTVDGSAGSAADAILRDAAAGSSGTTPCAGQAVTPVRAWDAPVVHEAGFSSLSWAASELKLEKASLSGSNVTAPIVRTDSGVSSADVTGVVSRALTEHELLRSEEHVDQVRNFLLGEVCVSLLLLSALLLYIDLVSPTSLFFSALRLTRAHSGMSEASSAGDHGGLQLPQYQALGKCSFGDWCTRTSATTEVD
jgi:hypothetical protein